MTLTGQRSLALKTGTYTLQPDSTQRSNFKAKYLFYDAGHVLTKGEITSLSAHGVEILYALKDNVYWIRYKPAFPHRYSLQLFNLDNEYKISPNISNRSASMQLRLSVAPGLSDKEVKEWSGSNNINVVDQRALSYGMLDVEIPEGAFNTVLHTPWVAFIEEKPVDEVFNYRLLHAERGWGLISPLFRGLNGSGMTIGIGDEGRLGIHEDLSSSIRDLASFGISNHSMQVAGIVAGSGLLDPSFGFGYAPKANVMVRNFSDILWNAPQYIADHHLALTNNSYGNHPFDCRYIGDYTGTSAALDAMMDSFPHLLHVFAAGNSGGITCSPYPIRHSTIAGGYQSAKNVLTVGALRIIDLVPDFSSRGPVDDGRLKPEVVAYGQGRFSTIINNDFDSNSGTSFSSPAAMGLATLLYQRYRQLHNDSFPEATLIKNIICNSADDLGLTGPDFSYGFGRINGVRAVEIIEGQQFASMVVSHNATITKHFEVLPGAASFDVLLMWNDYPAAPYETVSLVNDLDMIIIDPSGDTLKPWQMDYTPDGVLIAASKGADHTNNHEQITVTIPETGIYTVLVNGYKVLMGQQKAWLSWDIHQNGITLQSPAGGEIFKPGNPANSSEQQYIRWDAFGTGNSTFTVEYSTNGGDQWNVIATGIPPHIRHQGWYIPNIPTDKLKVRISATNGMSDTSDFNAVIMASPASVTVTSPCNGYLQLNWNAVAGADYYKIFRLKNEVLTEVDTTSELSILLRGFSSDTAYWMSVAGVYPSGVTGLRTRGVSGIANGGNNCGWNDDLSVTAITQPTNGRSFTSNALTASEMVSLSVMNTGTTDANGVTLSYQINQGPVITEPLSGILPGGSSQTFNFNQTADLSQAGEYDIEVWINYAPDTYRQNDTLRTLITHLPNPTVNLPFYESFETLPILEVQSSLTGLSNAPAWDVVLDDTARVRTFAGSPFCHTGSRALTVDASRNVSAESGEVLLTLNMENYTVETNDLRLGLLYMHHQVGADPDHSLSVYIRGSDLDSFVLLSVLPKAQALRGEWHNISGLNITDTLSKAGQDFSSSFQIKFPFTVHATAGDLTKEDGHTIDDISIEEITRDLELTSLINPPAFACGMGVEEIEVIVTNTSSKHVPSSSISYAVNEGSVFSMNIGTLPPDTSIHYVLTPTFDFTDPGTYDIKIWVSSANDTYQANDTLDKMILHSHLITSFPYREGFESTPVNWVSDGIHSSWVQGAPGKTIISHAAEGMNVWTTGLIGEYHPDELSYLYSPCFDLSDMTQPFLSFAWQYDLEANFDFAWVEYRQDGNASWTKLGHQNSGTNWYNHASGTWTGLQSQWHTTGIPIPSTDSTIQFRWVIKSDNGVENEGVAIDQINVYDNAPVYSGMQIQMMMSVSGNNWIHFDHEGQRLFSIHPMGQDAGDITLTLFKADQNFITADSFYLLARNWTLSGISSLADDVLMRAYFTNNELNDLLDATGCDECISSVDGFDIGVVRYEGEMEDGSFTNNLSSGVRAFSTDSVEVYPYDDGYYAEWSADDLSEWWISTPVTKYNGTLTRKITGSGDDAEQHALNGAVNPVRTTLSLTTHNGQQEAGWRFKNIKVPQGSYITSARIKWIARDTFSSPAYWTLQSQITTDADVFTTKKYDITLRTKSSQHVHWSPAPWVNNEEYESPEIRNLVQEVIDQPLWKNGNDLALILKGEGNRNAWSYEGDPLKSAELIISFENECNDSHIIYVNKDASGDQNGTSWMHAYKDLAQAIEKADQCPAITQIWLAGGTYAPIPDASRNASFIIRENLALYGGFEGAEISIEERIHGTNPSIISGEIGGLALDDNLYHVIKILPGTIPTLLDGLSIRGGMANGSTQDSQTGAGVYNQGRLYLSRVIIEENSSPSIYNAPGSELHTLQIVDIRD